MGKTTVKRSEMTIGLWLGKAAKAALEAERCLDEAESMAARAHSAGHAQGPAILTKTHALAVKARELTRALDEATR